MQSQQPRHEGRLRVLIEAVRPEIDAGAYAVKRIVGDTLEVSADLIADGHDVLGGAVLYRRPGEQRIHEVRLVPLGNDRYGAQVALDAIGLWHYTVVGWVDHGRSWHHFVGRKAAAGQADVEIELLVGKELCTKAAARAAAAKQPTSAERLTALAAALGDNRRPLAERIALATDENTAELLAQFPDRTLASRYPRELGVVVDRARAECSAWYELFPRSWGAGGVHATLRDVQDHLPYVADLGFDVVYLPPIHPIGQTHRKGKNNALTAEPGDVGSPWAIGDGTGGHLAVHPQLGTVADVTRLAAAAAELGLEVALDIAFQVSPDHPWVREHPAWFQHRPDGSIRYAENPPKKYQDIYPIDFDSSDWQALWRELTSVFRFWVERGIKIFRVDNPHTKSLYFWRHCIDDIRRDHPDVLFLAEAFTAPKLMYALAKLGFSQSYTYFTWRESAHDLRAYLEELTAPPVAEFFRPNFWPNTPDILPDHLAHAARGAFSARLVLAATLSGNYGIYGPAFELMDNQPRPGSGEYLDNEKYQLKSWDLSKEGGLRPLIRRVNRIRRQNAALHSNRHLRFHRSDNPALLCYSKRTADHGNVVLIVVSVDPTYRQGGFVELDLGELGLDHQPFFVRDLLGGGRYRWDGSRNYVELDPYSMPAHIFAIERPTP